MTENDNRIRWEEFLAGWGAGLINVTITYPLHKVMFRQMLHGVHTTKAVEQLRKEGLNLLYRGLLPPLCQKTVSTAIMFGGYKYYGLLLNSYFPNLNPQLAKSAGAGLAGISEAILTPFERIQTLLQDKHYNSRLNNTYHTVRHIWKHHGVFEYYRGVTMVILRNSVANILFFASREKAQHVLPKPHNIWTKYISDFISGGVIGASISTMFYPMNVIKTRMQCRLGGSFESPVGVLRIVFSERDRKISEMFRGAHLNYTRALLSWGIINASYELLGQLFYKFSNRIDKS